MLRNIFKKTPEQQEKFISELQRVHDRLDQLINELDARNRSAVSIFEDRMDILRHDLQGQFSKTPPEAPSKTRGRPKKRA